MKTFDETKEILFKDLLEAEEKFHDMLDNDKGDAVNSYRIEERYMTLKNMIDEMDLTMEYNDWQSHSLYVFDENKFIDDNLRFYPKANKNVLTFIANFLGCHGTDASNVEHLRATFHAGYCYYFAVILKTAFQRGEVCWVAPFGHMVWQDTDGMVYDIEGVYSGESEHFIPYQMIGDGIWDFMHVPGLEYNMSQEELDSIIKKYVDGLK